MVFFKTVHSKQALIHAICSLHIMKENHFANSTWKWQCIQNTIPQGNSPLQNVWHCCKVSSVLNMCILNMHQAMQYGKEICEHYLHILHLKHARSHVIWKGNLRTLLVQVKRPLRKGHCSSMYATVLGKKCCILCKRCFNFRVNPPMYVLNHAKKHVIPPTNM